MRSLMFSQECAFKCFTAGSFECQISCFFKAGEAGLYDCGLAGRLFVFCSIC